MEYNVQKLKDSVNAIFDEIVAIRRDLHMHPELGQQEVRTSKLVQDKLDEWGIKHWDEVAGHGVVAYIPGTDETRAFGVRGDMDALPIQEVTESPFKSVVPGVMHACGHDVHTAILLGTAKLIKDMSPLPVGVKFFFQPSEETIGGADQMIKAGFMENPKVEKMLALHISPNFKVGVCEIMPGPMNAACASINVKVIGKSAHGAYPHKGLDPLIPACAMVMEIQSIISRLMDPFDAGLVTIGNFHSGTKDNVIPAYTTFSGTVRGTSTELCMDIANKAKRICENTAAAYGAGIEVEVEQGYPALINTVEMAELLRDVCTKVLGREFVHYKPRPTLGADDFAFFSSSCPSIYYNLGTARPDDDNPALLHDEKLDVDENCMINGMLSEVGMLLEMM